MADRRVAPARRRLRNLVSTDETAQHPATSRRVTIVTDSTTYLPQSLIERWAIGQVSLYVGWGGDLRPEHDYRDLDAFFRHPANEFQMRVIAKKLDGFASALARRP